MVYAYIRVSSDKQTVENQRFEITRFCQENHLHIDVWVEETISGTTSYGRRRLGKLLKRVRQGDLIVCSELSRLGRNLYLIMEILSQCMNAGCRVWTIKDRYRLGDDLQSKILAFAFSLSAEIERTLISQRTREALARLRAEGCTLGRPRGSTGSPTMRRLQARRADIVALLRAGVSKAEVARRFRVSRASIYRLLQPPTGK